MQVFHCDYCDNLVFFENTTCIDCGHALAFMPDVGEIGSLEATEGNLWRAHHSRYEPKLYRLCGNYVTHNVCNWAIPEQDPHELCLACRLTTRTHDLTIPGAREIWYKLEVAKRRLIYSLLTLGCPLESKLDDAEQGLAFEFLADPTDPEAPPVLTGHANGLITVNIAEADDVERKRRQLAMGEPYRTLLGHFRHESGHYYWDRFIANTSRLEEFRSLFGDEQADYAAALEAHYQRQAAGGSLWQQEFVSEYASAHPWEDWAETWAHYLHMTDTLETALTCGVTLKPRRKDEPRLKPHALLPHETNDFDQLIERWFPLTYVLNNLNRGLGLADGYPFILHPPVINKLKFIHNTIRSHAEQTKVSTTQIIPGTGFWKRIFGEGLSLLF